MTPVYCQLGKDAGGVLLLQFNAGGALAAATAGRALPGRTSQHSFNILIIILLQTGFAKLASDSWTNLGCTFGQEIAGIQSALVTNGGVTVVS